MQVVSRQLGFDLQFSNDSQMLLTAAETYYWLGYSVIPLLGNLDPSRPKVPAIPWAGFQQRRASLQEQQDWFREGGFGGLGIVTGRISGLVVLDFDDHGLIRDFKARFPDILETRTILSAGRQLPHYYYRLPPHLNLPSMKGQGADLLSDGCYVVAPPTMINGQSYTIIRGGMPKTLTEYDIGRIRAFMSRHKTQPTDCTDHTQRLVEIAKKPSTPASGLYPQAKQATHQDLSRIYQYHCQKGGRNEALFRTSLYARDTGWQPVETQNCLVPLHVQQAKPHETSAQRQREGTCTIQSAFSRPARPIQARAPRHTGQLSNSVREALMQRKMTYFIRTYEGLLHHEVQPGQVIKSKEAIEPLKGLVGRDSVWKALNAEVDGQRLFPPPVAPPKTAYAVATDNPTNNSDICISEGSKNQDLIGRGRPQHLFRMPTNEELCAILGVKETGSDPLQQEDLATAHQTRMALHRELIKRRPGQYRKGWLARRLGVSRRTIATYNELIPIHSKEMFIETRVFWNNIERLLPLDEPIQGAVLVTIKGKRYPALRTIASRLLARGDGITLKQQTANFYWFGDEEPIMERLQLQQEVVIKQERVEKFIAKQISRRVNPSQPQELSKPVKAKPRVMPNCRKPLKDAAHEAQAQYLYTSLNENGAKRLSLVNARRLAVTHDAVTITSALELLTKRPNVSNPVGFILTVLRQQQKEIRI